jgi:hypothetical protein
MLANNGHADNLDDDDLSYVIEAHLDGEPFKEEDMADD